MHTPVTTDRPLTLDVTDCGPVTRGCVELRPLTVFVGPSNTGKSWLATLTYALHRYFGTGPWVWPPWVDLDTETPALPEDAGTDLIRIAEQLKASTSRNAEPPAKGIELTPSVEAAIRLYFGQQGGPLGEEIERCFGVDASHLVRKGSAGHARILLRHAVEGLSAPAKHELSLSDEGWTLQSAVPDGLRTRGNRQLRVLAELEHEGEQAQTSRAQQAIRALAREVLPLDDLPAFYLPADRTGLMNALSTIVSILIESAMARTRRADPVPALSGVRGDFLKELMEMASGRRRRPRRGGEALRDVGKRLEDGILRGAIGVRGLPGIAYPHFTYRPSGWESDLPLTNTSSMVSELAPVVLYLRHVVAPGDLLIIDEPESHLHPAMQVAFTRQIAEIVRAGVRIIVTTHSEWVLEELGNIVGRSRLTDRGDGKSGAGALAARDVGVWLFEPAENGSGSTVQEIAMDDDTGLYPSGFAAVAAGLHNDWAEIAEPRGDTE